MANKPNIRFKGFTDDWEQRKVTEIGEIYIGLVTTMTSHYTNQGALLIRNSDIKDSRFEFGDNPIYLDDEFAKQNASRKHRVGDVITVHTGDIGTSAVITDKEVGSIGFATIVTRPDMKKIISEYLCAYLNTDTHKNFALNISTGDGRNNYNLKDYYECVVPVPNIAEQRKISRFIDEMNHLITLHQRKCDETKKLKKFMLQKMFPKNGEKNPEIRFAGFTDDWEQRKLGEITNKGTKKNTELQYNETFTNSAEFGIISQSDFFDHSVSNPENICGYYIVENNSFVYNPRISNLAPVGPINRNKLGRIGIMSPLYTVFEVKNINVEYLEWFFKSSHWHSFMYFNGDTGARADRFSIKDTLFFEMPIPIPDIDEQAKIGEYFSTLDHLITLHQRKCDKLKLIKKFMLQNMFPKKG